MKRGLVAFLLVCASAVFATEGRLQVEVSFKDEKTARAAIQSAFPSAKISGRTITFASKKPKSDLTRISKSKGVASATAVAPAPPKAALDETRYSKMRAIFNQYKADYIVYHKALNGDKAEFRDKVPQSGYLQAYLHFMEERSYPNDVIDWEAYARAEQQRSRMPVGNVGPDSLFETDFVNNWQFVGPKNFSIPYQTYYGQSPLGGRMNSVAIHPTQSNTFYAAGAQSGLWKTTDGGLNWSQKSDSWPNSRTSVVAIHPTNGNIVLVGTGDWKGGLGPGYGIQRSTDGGTTWTVVGAAQFNGISVADIVIDPDDPNIMIAAGRSGVIFRSSDAGITWTSVTGTSRNYNGLSFGAKDGSNVRPLYACAESSSPVLRSLDRGLTWTALSTPFNNTVGIDLDASKVDSNVVYALDGSGQRVWKSIDRGTNWTNISAGFPNSGPPGPTYNWAQSSYNHHLTVSRNGSNDVIYVGEIDVAQSPDGGATWRAIGRSYYSDSILHNDQHSFAVDPQNPNRCLIGNDGGVYRLDYNPAGAGSWNIASLNATLGGSTQFYHAAYHPTDPTKIVGGTQDNASPTSTGNLNAWINPGAGDGGWAGISPINPNIQYNTWQFLGMYKTTNGWASRDYIEPSYGTDSVAFIPPIQVDSQVAADVYAGTNYLWRYNGSAWTARLGGVALSATGNLRTIAVAPSNNNYLYTGASDGQVWMSINRGSTWTNISSGLPARGIKDIAVNPTNPNSIVLTLGGSSGVSRVYRCVNTTASTVLWEARSGAGGTALPDITTNSISINPANSNIWYVGNDVGVFVTKDAGATWSNVTAPRGLPNVRVDDVTTVPGQNSLYAATHGRGIWKIDIGSVALSGLTATPNPVYSANDVTFTVQLSGPAPAGGAIVSLLSANNSILSVPSSVTVPQGATSATFVGLAPWRATDTTVNISATMNDVTQNRLVTVKWLQADINRDGIVDLTDYTIVATAFNAQPGDANWNPAADLDGNLIIDLTDYTIIALQFNLGG